VTRTAAVEYGGRGIRVNALCPGVVGTDATLAFGIDWNEIMPTPLGRIARPGEIAELAAWLLSDRSSYVTGQAINADGGITAATFIPK
jgi:NAD(P)-dependent dehydrogenase (short-subunit alcohol dehydrogenase family)